MQTTDKDIGHWILLSSLWIVLGVVWAGLAGTALGEEAASLPTVPLALSMGDTHFVDLDEAAERVSIANPDVAEAMAVTPRQIMIHAKTAGSTSLAIWSVSGRRGLYTISVRLDATPLRAELHELFPAEAVQVRTARDALVLSGEVREAHVVARMVELAKLYSKNVVNLIHTPRTAPAEEPQVSLQVRFAEVDRTAGRELGVNLLSTGAANTPGAIGTGQFGHAGLGEQGRLRGQIGARTRGTASEFALSDILNIFAFRPDLNLAAALRALQSRGLLEILAEPNLITRNGKEASFLAGGEFPYAVVSSAGGTSFPAVHVQFKEFGIRLRFTPTVTATGTIILKVRPEVSDLDLTNAVTVSGFLLPSIRTRRAETEIELRDGQSFAIAGLIDNRVIEQYHKIPGLGDIPVLGNIFKSKSIRKTNNELIVIVTPRMVRPLDAMKEKPATPEWDVPFLRAPSSGTAGPEPPSGGSLPAARPEAKAEERDAPSRVEDPDLNEDTGRIQVPPESQRHDSEPETKRPEPSKETERQLPRTKVRGLPSDSGRRN